MSPQNGPGNRDRNEDDLFDEIREFLAEQSGDRIYEELSRAYTLAEAFAERELRGHAEYARMLRGIERLVDDVIGNEIGPEMRSRFAEILYLYGLAHYSLLQQSHEELGSGKSGPPNIARPLIVHDIWFPGEIAMEETEDGYYLHITDGRIDVSLFLGESPNDRGAVVDFVDHWEYASANTEGVMERPDLTGSVPLMAIEMDYAGSDIIDASDHVDLLLFDHRGEPVVRIHARDSDLRDMLDAMQNSENDGGL